jgi:putative toxin-antitoxin system antitoxin component (TIGR02293 family)
MWRIFCDILLIFVQNYLIMKTINEKKNRLTSDTDVLSLINTVRKGVNYTLFFTVYEKSSINIHEWSNILHVSERTMQRYKKESINFEPLQSEKILQVAFIIEKGQKVFGDHNKFSQWLGAENLALGGAKPKELLDNTFGITLIEEELVKIEYGIFA